jgi:hypothetical protein
MRSHRASADDLRSSAPSAEFFIFDDIRFEQERERAASTRSTRIEGQLEHAASDEGPNLG